MTDQPPTGPTGVFAQSNARVSSAISPAPIIRGDEVRPLDWVLTPFGFEVRGDDGMVND